MEFKRVDMGKGGGGAKRFSYPWEGGGGIFWKDTCTSGKTSLCQLLSLWTLSEWIK